MGSKVKKTIPYNPEHRFINDGYNDGYFGASLLAIHDLLVTKGFCLIAVESSGTNAFFVKKEFSKHFEILSPIRSWRSVGRWNTETEKKRIKQVAKDSKFIEI